MQIIKRNPREERNYERLKKKEEFKRDFTLLIAKLLKKQIDPEDTRTIQKHIGAGGGINYYVQNNYLQGTANFTNVQTIIEDNENNRYVYKGMITGANNAMGVIESNVPLRDIVASPYGNIEFLKMISEENAMKMCHEYYQKIGEPTKPLDNHSTYFGKPDFVLGTILKDDKGKFSYSSNIQQDIEEILKKDRKNKERNKLMRDEDSVELDLGGGMVVAKQDCWINPGKNISFGGINNEALYWKYMPDLPIAIENGKYYIQIGTMQIGESKSTKKDNIVQFINPYIYENVVIYTKGKKLIQYFLNNKLDGLNLTLGEIVNTYNVEKCKKDASKLNNDVELQNPIIIGGIEIDEYGEVKKCENIPDEVIQEAKSAIEKKKEKNNNIIKFDRGNR